MTIGLLSDTHDNLPAIARAAAFFNQNKTGYVLHAGDFVAPFALKPLGTLSCPWQGVFGNNDGERQGLAAASKGAIQEGPLRLELEGKKIVVVHSLAQIDPEKIEADLIVCGHDHQPKIQNRKKLAIVDPGECCGWLSGISTVALFDLSAMQGAIHRL